MPTPPTWSSSGASRMDSLNTDRREWKSSTNRSIHVTRTSRTELKMNRGYNGGFPIKKVEKTPVKKIAKPPPITNTAAVKKSTRQKDGRVAKKKNLKTRK